jgi:hypothetical protein
MVLSFLAFSAFAHADGIPGDPVMQVDDPTCGGPDQPTCPVVFAGIPFTFSANADGGGATSFQVDPSGTGFFNLDIETAATFGTTSNIQCFSDAFECQVRFLGNVTDIFLSENGDAGKNGFPEGAIFTIDLGNLVPNTDCNPNTGLCPTTEAGGWNANEAFVGQANLPNGAPTSPLIPSPEPSSIFLLAAGATALFGKRTILKR